MKNFWAQFVVAAYAWFWALTFNVFVRINSGQWASWEFVLLVYIVIVATTEAPEFD